MYQSKSISLILTEIEKKKVNKLSYNEETFRLQKKF